MRNTEGTFILGNSTCLKEIVGTFIEAPTLNTNEEDKIHDWVIQLFKKNEIEKVIIEIGENPLLSLQIGYHIRLSIEDLQTKTLVPILFVSTLSLNSIMLQTEIYSQILAIKGVFFSEFDLQSNKIEIQHLNGLNEKEYLTMFLKIIHIQPDETIGRHSLANIWGAYIMDKISYANALTIDSEFKKKLYFKYVSAFNNLVQLKASALKILGHNNWGSVNKIIAENKRILFIDDEADKGWASVLKKVFKTTSAEDFVVINEKVRDFNTFSGASKHIIETEKFDLYLVDLRLNGLEEEETLKTEEFSGMKVLQKIKSLNQGNQVIIFTASNKVWNLKALFDEGAEGYYLKESPEYNFTRKISEQKFEEFKRNATRCFGRKYLCEVYTHLSDTKNNDSNSSFIAESNAALEIAWELIKNEYLDFGFLTLYQCVESYANKIFCYDNFSDSYEINGIIVIENIGKEENKWLLAHNKDTKNGDYFSLGQLIQKRDIKPTALYKISCLLYFKYHKGEGFLKNFGKLNKLRNNISHHGVKGDTKKEHLIEILQILKEIRSN